MSSLKALIEAMRPKQWAKNVFVFAPLVFDVKLFHPIYLTRTVAGFLLLCLVSGAVYLINDLVDIEKDRQHPRKRNRPLASGRLSPRLAIAAAAILILLGLPAGFLLHPAFGGILLVYLALQIAYSFYLKNLVIIDVLALAAGFVLRVAAGIPLVDAERFSPWIYTCMGLLALFIGFAKRRHELALMGANANAHRESLAEYNLPLLDQLITIVTAATLVSYSLYTFSAPNLPPNHLMMLTIPLVLFSVFRYLYLVHVKGMGGEPEEIVLRDRPLQAGVLLWGLAVVLILYLR
ncbi:MAG: decaprenyl-phosphate phosphoribosyltransferase [Anaerolineae bacterium]|nr:decaprenyl-phosphate phosphoribosyltransferase [Anaerolineae bacterium]MCX8067986.1 decaprenyl-phosphate phosphoribosyltransferase [Anaerolineae bacterium]MDW7992564.1 decaprenyl-phosphate phosphoribosyltransferase [Anaerolineae bacterium]